MPRQRALVSPQIPVTVDTAEAVHERCGGQGTWTGFEAHRWTVRSVYDHRCQWGQLEVEPTCRFKVLTSCPCRTMVTAEPGRWRR